MYKVLYIYLSIHFMKIKQIFSSTIFILFGMSAGLTAVMAIPDFLHYGFNKESLEGAGIFMGMLMTLSIFAVLAIRPMKEEKTNPEREKRAAYYKELFERADQKSVLSPIHSEKLVFSTNTDLLATMGEIFMEINGN